MKELLLASLGLVYAALLSSAVGNTNPEWQWQFRAGDDLVRSQWPATPDSEERRHMAEAVTKESRKVPGSEEVQFTGEAPAPESDLLLWYRLPAREWVEAAPVGNGRLGAMVFGGVVKERLQLNEESVWDGYARDTTKSNALKSLPEVRRLLLEGKNEEANQLAARDLM
jgi:hypothetical protein